VELVFLSSSEKVKNFESSSVLVLAIAVSAGGGVDGAPDGRITSCCHIFV
jgi:hypothetical protein